MEAPEQPAAKKAQDCSVARKWLPLVAYGISLFLTIGWESGSLWSGMCGTPAMMHLFLCQAFAFLAALGLIWAILVWHDENAAWRFTLSGSIPLLFPWALGQLV